MWKNNAQPDRPRITIWLFRFACWIPKATNTHSEYAIRVLTVFPPQYFCCTNAPQCYIIRTLPVLLNVVPNALEFLTGLTAQNINFIKSGSNFTYRQVKQHTVHSWIVHVSWIKQRLFSHTLSADWSFTQKYTVFFVIGSRYLYL
jgi:hypothetical protein